MEANSGTKRVANVIAIYFMICLVVMFVLTALYQIVRYIR
jgi:cytochrome c-type biogenesis protein CcmE